MVWWEEKNSVSAVLRYHFPDGDPVTVGETYAVHIMRKEYTGCVAATCGGGDGEHSSLKGVYIPLRNFSSHLVPTTGKRVSQ